MNSKEGKRRRKKKEKRNAGLPYFHVKNLFRVIPQRDFRSSSIDAGSEQTRRLRRPREESPADPINITASTPTYRRVCSQATR